MEVEIG